MSIIAQERASDSPYVDTITHGYTTCDGSTIRPAESHWHMVLVRHQGKARTVVVGPLSHAGVVSWEAGAEILWIKFRLGTFMPHLPIQQMLDRETFLPEAANKSFWLQGSTWQIPDFENADTFVDRLARNHVLVCDPVVGAVLQDEPQTIASRTIRHRFLRATGLTRTHIRQIERARQAAALLQQGTSIPDAMFESGYFDQPHLTRSLKQWVGHTPAQIVRMSALG